MNPRRYTLAQIRGYADRALESIQSRGGEVVVWWSLPDNEFLTFGANGRAGRLLTARLDQTLLACYVGIFDPKSNRFEIEEALEAHAQGHMQGVA